MQISVVGIATETFGSTHPDTLRYKAGLAAVYSGQGKLEESLRLLMEVLPSAQKTLGNEHPDVLSLLTDLATLYLNMNDYESAARMYERVIKLNERLNGRNYDKKGLHMAFLSLSRSGLMPAAAQLRERHRDSEGLELPWEKCWEILEADHELVHSLLNERALE